jgi:hypothetical protein
LDSLYNDISELSLCFDFQQKDVNFMCEQCFDNSISLQNKHIIEKKKIRLKQRLQQCFTIEIKTAINRRDFLKKKFNNLRAKGIINNKLFDEYKKLRNCRQNYKISERESHFFSY